MYCLIWFYYVLREPLAGLRPLPKLMCIKAVVFFTFWCAAHTHTLTQEHTHTGTHIHTQAHSHTLAHTCTHTGTHNEGHTEAHTHTRHHDAVTPQSPRTQTNTHREASTLKEGGVRDKCRTF